MFTPRAPGREKRGRRTSENVIMDSGGGTSGLGPDEWLRNDRGLRGERRERLRRAPQRRWSDRAWARANPAAVGMLADNTGGGTALQVNGRAKFSTAGIAVVASGQKKVTVTLAGVTTTDFILATVQGSGAFYVKNASAGSGQFTIFINKAPTAPATVTVAYFVISAP